jgi:hypothetical protein
MDREARGRCLGTLGTKCIGSVKISLYVFNNKQYENGL